MTIKIMGLVLILCGIALGVYIGFWVFLIGGIIQIVEAIRSENLIVLDIAIGTIRIFFAGFFGVISVYTLAIPGFLMLTK